MVNKKPQNNAPLYFKRLAYLIAILSGCVPLTSYARVYFNPELLEIDNPNQGSTDLTVFEEAATQAPGIYRVDIFINKELQDARDIEFRMENADNGKESLKPCISVAMLNEMGVKASQFPAIGDVNTECANLNAIPQASAEFRFNTQQLMLSIPQAAMSQQARGFVSERQWDNGIPAFLLNYSLSGDTSSTETSGGSGKNSSNSQYANLRPGLNIGPWRVRNYTTWIRDSEGQNQWDAVYTYVERSIIAMKSVLSLGDRTSPSDVFDSVPFRGAQLSSDDDMMPDSLKGYSPVVRGIARSNAQVIIRQNGYVIYQSYVAPGAFEINDMYATGGSGDLNVTIKEADGSEQQFVVPFASLPVLQREGRLKYAITGGQYRAYNKDVEKTAFGQGTSIYGLPYGLTIYGGAQFSSPYQSLAVGIGKNIGLMGAISVDVTQARSTLKDKPTDQGQSWRFRYSKNVVETGTNFAIAGYRYSTDGYYGLQETLDTYRDNVHVEMDRRRNRSELTLSQTLWWENAGSLALSLINESYWNSDRNMRSAGLSYNSSWNDISYGLSYSYNENVTANGSSGGGGGKIYDRDQVLAFNISVPLSLWMSNTYASYSINTSKTESTVHNLALNGTALADNNLSWSLQQGYDESNTGYSGNLNADYRGTYAQVNAGYAYDGDTQRLNYGLQGSVVAHENGVTFGQPLGETAVLVKAPGARGVGVSNQTGVKTDWRGYAIVPYSSPYRKNQVRLETSTLPDDVELIHTSQTVIPTRGAVSRANFNVNVGLRALMTLRQPGGETIPFGAIVSVPTWKTSQGFIVGDSGQVYLAGLPEKGTLQVTWGNGDQQQCQVNYSMAAQPTDTAGVQLVNGECR